MGGCRDRICRRQIDRRDDVRRQIFLRTPSEASPRTDIHKAERAADRKILDERANQLVPMDGLGKDHVDDGLHKRRVVFASEKLACVSRPNGNMQIRV